MIVYGVNPVAEALKAGRVKRLLVGRRDDQRLQRLLALASAAPCAGGTRRGHGTRPAQSRRRAPGRGRRSERRAGLQRRRTRAGRRRARRCWSCSTASKTRTTSARSCEAWTPRARMASSARRATRPRSTRWRPRPRPAPSRTCRWPTSSTSRARSRSSSSRTSGSSGWPAMRRSRTSRSTGRRRRRSCLAPKAAGCGRLVRESCDFLVSIPMAGHVDSLNVSVAAGVVLFEAARQRRAVALVRRPNQLSSPTTPAPHAAETSPASSSRCRRRRAGVRAPWCARAVAGSPPARASSARDRRPGTRSACRVPGAGAASAANFVLK